MAKKLRFKIVGGKKTFHLAELLLKKIFYADEVELKYYSRLLKKFFRFEQIFELKVIEFEDEKMTFLIFLKITDTCTVFFALSAVALKINQKNFSDFVTKKFIKIILD